MPHWLRTLLAVAAGFLVWWLVATVGNFGLRWLIAGYTQVERSMDFSTDMLVARLATGALASVAAGAACAALARGGRGAAYLLAAVILALFVPVHLGLWSKFPIWYHVVFLGSLAPLIVLGARLLRTRRAPGA